MKRIISIICFTVAMTLFVHPAISLEAEWVTVEGFAALENVTKQEARLLAIADARRNAVEKIVGVDLVSETLVINSEISGDVICTIPYTGSERTHGIRYGNIQRGRIWHLQGQFGAGV